MSSAAAEIYAAGNAAMGLLAPVTVDSALADDQHTNTLPSQYDKVARVPPGTTPSLLF